MLTNWQWFWITVLGFLLLWVAAGGCGTLPEQQAGTTGDVAGDVQQFVEQMQGIHPAVLVAGGAWAVAILLAVVCAAIVTPNPKREAKWFVLGVGISGLVAATLISVVAINALGG
jgi:hypothetical protein